MPGLNLLGLWIYGLNIANANITQMVRCHQHTLLFVTVLCFGELVVNLYI